MKVISAVIGMGVGSKHLEAIDSIKNAEVKYICEKNLNLIKILRKKYPKKKIIKNPEIIYKDKSINLVSIASYDEDHFDQVKNCLNANKHVIVEKPICLLPKQLKIIKKILDKKKKLKLLSNLVLRTNSLFKILKKKIKGKKIYYIEADYLWGRIKKLYGWRSKEKNYSIISGAGVHMIDLVMWLLNSKPNYVFSTGNKIATNNSKFKKNSFEIIVLEFPNNIKVKITANGPCIFDHFHELKIFTKNQTFVHSFKGTFNVINKKKKRVYSIINGSYPDKKNRKVLIQNFVKSIVYSKKIDILSKKEIFDAMSVCFSAVKSSQKNKRLKISYLN